MSEIAHLWIGDDKQGRFISEQDKAMDSLIYYYEDENPSVNYNYHKLFLDNGAYTATRLNKELDSERVKDIQERINPDFTIPLDFPFTPCMPVGMMKKRWENTMKNILDWQQTTSLRELIPILHAWNVKSLIWNVRWLQKNADSEFIGLGSIVCYGFDDYKGYLGDRQPRKQLMDMLITAVQIVRKYSDFKAHMAGFGSSPLMLFLGYYCGINSTDTTGYKRKAAFGKISLPGKGDRHIGKPGAVWGTQKLRREEIELLKECQCPICRQDQSLLYRDWKARAMHNKYVLQQEELHAKDLLEKGENAYEDHLNKIFAGSGIEYLWKYTKLRTRYWPIDYWLL